MIRLSIVTLVTRPQNLDRIGSSIESSLYGAFEAPDVEVKWVLVYDQRRLGDVKHDSAIGADSGFVVMPTADWQGEPYLRNFALDQIHGGHIVWLDDDNLLDGPFIARTAELLTEDETKAIVYDQRLGDGSIRLRAGSGNMHVGSIDTAQVIAPRELYDGLRFRNVGHAQGVDGYMYEAMFAAHPERFRFVSEARVFYNALG